MEFAKSYLKVYAVLGWGWYKRSRPEWYWKIVTGLCAWAALSVFIAASAWCAYMVYAFFFGHWISGEPVEQYDIR